MDNSLELARLRARLSAAEKELKAVQRDNLTADKIREALYKLPSPSNPPTWLMTSASPANRTVEIPCTIWSDWHWGEVVAPEEVGGLNTYNRVIARNRVRRLVEAMIDLTRNHAGKNQGKYPGVVVCLGGDMITGDIHEELRETNDGTVQQSLLDVESTLISALDTVAKEYGRVYVPCVVGNHGRGTLKPRAKNRAFTSFEWNLYCHLERHFAGDKRLHFTVAEGADVAFRVFNHRFLLTHGDSLGVRGGDGIIGALGPIARGAVKVGRQQAQIGKDFDTLLMGHYHAYLPRGDLAPVVVNPSLIGPSAYSHLILRVPPSRPSQALWWVHPVRGITAQRQVSVEASSRAAAPAEWVSWRKAA